MAEDLKPYPTKPLQRPLRLMNRDRWLRRIALALFFALVALGLTNVLGPRSATVRATGGGFELRVDYLAVNRPGLTTPLAIEVRRPGGFDGTIAIAMSRAYLALLDMNFVHPEPSKQTGGPEVVVWEFDPPPGETLRVTVDARLEPASHDAVLAETSVLVERRPVVTVRYETKVVP